jgi:hypothetical protein
MKVAILSKSMVFKCLIIFCALVAQLAARGLSSAEASESVGQENPAVARQIIHRGHYDPLVGSRQILRARFVMEQSTGQAMAEFDYFTVNNDVEGATLVYTVRRPVRGLTYNWVTGETLYNGNGLSNVPCSQLINDTFVSTGRCTVYSRTGVGIAGFEQGSFDVYFYAE